MTTNPPPPARSSSRTWMGILTLVILLALLLGFWRYSENLIASLEYQAQSLRENEEILRIVAAPDVVAVPLTGTADHPQAYGKLMIEPGTGDAAVYVQGVPATAGDQRYCLWLAAEKAAVRVAEFAFTDTSRTSGSWYFGTVDLTSLAAGSWSLTLESQGNRSAPEGPAVLSGPTR